MSNLLNTITGIGISSVSPIVYAKAIPVTFSVNVSGTALSAIGVDYQQVWQFGDGEYSYENSPIHIFSSKGIYPIKYTVSIVNPINNEVLDEQLTFTTTVSVYNYIEDTVEWKDGDYSTYQSIQQDNPFVIAISSSNVGTDIPWVQLYARNSQSQPWQEPQQKWSHLKPQWRFLDTSSNVITSLVPTTYTPIMIDLSGNRADIGTLVGLSAEMKCYYIDDIPSQNIDNSTAPVTLVATLITSAYKVDNEPSYSNTYNNTNAIITHNIKALVPDHFNITVNGITPFPTVIWENAYTPYTVTVHASAPNDGIILKNFPLVSLIDSAYTQSLSNISLSDVTFNNDIEFQRFEPDTGFDIGGYIRGTFYPLVSAQSTNVTVSGVVEYANLVEPYGAWISNPSYHQLVHVSVQDNQTINQYTSAIYTIPDSQIYGIARVVGEDSDRVWVTDPTNDIIYRVSRNYGIDLTVLPSTFYALSTTPALSDFFIANDQRGLTPTGIVLNSAHEPWVALFGGLLVTRLDNDTGNIEVVTYPVPLSAASYLDTPGLSGFGGDFLYQPNKIDVDTLDNIWVSYNHPLSSFLVKYDTNGNFITKVNLPLYSKPYDIIVDKYDNIWATLSYAIGTLSGVVVKYNSSGTLLSAVSGFRDPAYITLDFDQNPWFVHDYNKVTKINSTGATNTFTISSNSLSADPAAPVNLNTLYDQELGGISCDWYNRIWVLNSYDNQVYMLSATGPTAVSSLQIYPAANNFTYSLQGYGDLHGVQWYNKFGNVPLSAVSNNVVLALSGSSDTFSIQDFESAYDIRKINEDFDGVNKVRAITLQETIKRNDVLFNSLIAPIAGTYDGDPLLPGTAIYEKIANFVGNHGDIDTCNIPQLYSLHKTIGSPIDDYNISYPSDVKRIMDILSINLSHLLATRSKFSKDFKKYNVASSGSNIGPLLDTNTYILSAGQYIVANIKYSTNFEKIEIAPITSDVLSIPSLSANYNFPLSAFPLSSFPLSSYAGWGLDTPVGDYYYFYTYIPGYDDTQVEGIIDWDNTNTTLNENISSINDWYKDGGIVDLFFNYYMFRGLGLIKD